MIRGNIKEKFIKLKESARIFADKQRLKQGKIYIPRALLGISPTEFIAVIKDIKPVVLWSIPEEKLNSAKQGLKEIEEIYGLNYKISEKRHLINSNRDFSQVISRNNSEPGNFWVSISKSKDLVLKSNFYYLKKLKERDPDSRLYSYKFGKLMGYPECCLKFADSLSGNFGDEKAIHKNYIWSKAHIRSLMNSKKISPLLNIFTGAPLVSHVPCHLNCQESKKYANKILKELEKENFKYTSLKKHFLFNLNSLFWYYTHFILLKGKKIGGNFEYQDYLPIPFSGNKSCGIRKFYNPDTNFQKKFEKSSQLIQKGNLLKMQRDCIQVFKEKKKIGEIKKEWEFEVILF